MKTVKDLADDYYESGNKFEEFIRNKFPNYDKLLEAFLEVVEDGYDNEFREWCWQQAEAEMEPDPDEAYQRQVEENYGEFQRSLM